MCQNKRSPNCVIQKGGTNYKKIQEFICISSIISILLASCITCDTVSVNSAVGNGILGTFPQGFKFGLGTSAFQIEGGFAEDGKGETIWDRFTHDHPEKIVDKSNASISADSYHRYKEDVAALKSVGANIYRFSLAWSRILPKGTTEVINAQGIQYYENLIDELIRQGIEPMVCLFHWDLPQRLQENGGWLNREIIGIFGEYARLVYKTFGGRVKYWLTINEPYTFCYYGYDKGTLAPGITENPSTDPYSCVHTQILAHALAYRIYKEEFFQEQKGKVGISLDNFWQEPGNPDSEEDRNAAQQSYSFRFDWLARPLFKGEYPPIMRTIIDEKSKKEGRKESRLPKFEGQWVSKVNGSLDFLGINHFTTELVKFANANNASNWEADSGTFRYYDPHWPGTGSRWLRVFPEGIRKSLNKIRKDYGNPEVIITENGMSDLLVTPYNKDYLNDEQRVDYHRRYIKEVFKSVIDDGCNVTGYIAWSLLDSFAFSEGYTQKFGVFQVDFDNPNRTRTPKKSAKALEQIFRNKGFPVSYHSGNLKFRVVSVPANFSPYDAALVSAPFAAMFSAYYAYNYFVK